MSKTFSLAAKRAANAEQEQESRLEFEIEGTEDKLYIRPPKEGQIALVMSVMGGYSEGSEQVATVINVFMNMLVEESAQVIKRRLLDMEDDFDLEDVMSILQWAVEQSAARPTKSPRGSTPSRTSTGPSSTESAPVRALTRSRSPRTASAT